MSTRSQDKTVETADKPVYDVLFFFVFVFCLFFFFLFLVNGIFVCFQESFNKQYQVGTVYAAGFFFLRDHRRTSPFSNLFKIL